MELRPYAPPTFWLPQGARAKKRQLERKGFPDCSGWRFVTLTIDREAYPDPCLAWMICKRHLRQFVYLLRKKYGIRRWCWKMEFHESDEDGRVYPHWHLLLDYKVPIDKDDILKLWGKGRTEIKQVRNQDFQYLFKYCAKSVEEIPDWIANRTCVRLFQTSRGFFPAQDSADDVAETEGSEASPRLGEEDQTDPATKNGWINDETIGERLERWSRYVVSRSISPDGSVRHNVYEMQCASWGRLLVSVSLIKLRSGIACSDLQITENCITTTSLCHLSSFLPASI